MLIYEILKSIIEELVWYVTTERMCKMYLHGPIYIILNIVLISKKTFVSI